MPRRRSILALRRAVWAAVMLALGILSGSPARAQSQIMPSPLEGARYQNLPDFPNGMPAPVYQLSAHDGGVVMTHGDGPNDCDMRGARDVYVFIDKGTYYMTYDGAGPTGWLSCLATSRDGLHWHKRGTLLALGKPGEADSASASYGVPYFDGKTWRMFYLATDKATSGPDFVPIGPYYTMLATAPAPQGPWTKRPGFFPLPQGPAQKVNASPGPIFRKNSGGYRMFFEHGVADTTDLDGTWTVVSPGFPNERCENQAIYYQPSDKTWFCFTDHIGAGYTDAIWVYWTHDPLHWDAHDSAVVLDGKNCTWSKTIVGLPSVVKVGSHLAIYYDGNSDPKDTWHMKRDVGVAYLKLPIRLPKDNIIR